MAIHRAWHISWFLLTETVLLLFHFLSHCASAPAQTYFLFPQHLTDNSVCAAGNSFENSWVQKLNYYKPFLSRAEQSIPWAQWAFQLHWVPYWWLLLSATGKLKRLNNLIQRTEKLPATVLCVRYYRGHWHSNFIKKSTNTLGNHIMFWHY